jgi:ubiquinone biosynthesis protein COQ9
MRRMSPPDSDTAERIVDMALRLGAERGWSALHLHEIAAALQLPLAELVRHYPQQDAIAEAWFDRADAALLACAERPGWADLTPRERLRQAMLAWFDLLAPHRRLAAEMLGYKLQPEHLHLQLQGLLRISRTVQCWREVALLRSSGWRRELEEALLSAIYLSSFARWLRDAPSGQAWLDRQLRAAEWLAARGTKR